jgi:hypothetical protein
VVASGAYACNSFAGFVFLAIAFTFRL